jgi:hypothetical protein
VSCLEARSPLDAAFNLSGSFDNYQHFIPTWMVQSDHTKHSLKISAKILLQWYHVDNGWTTSGNFTCFLFHPCLIVLHHQTECDLRT